MDTSRYIDLYLAETHEHLRMLNGALLELEDADDRTTPIEEAFRSAHTIKGASAMLGFDEVAGRAHELENRLDALRGGDATIDTELVDELLAFADALETAVRDSVEAGAVAEIESTGGDDAVPTAGPDADEDVPEGTEHVVRVELRAGANLKGARALVVLRRAMAAAPVLGSAPAESDLGHDDFDGAVRLFLGSDADLDAVETAVRGAGDVENVVVEAEDEEAGAAPSEAPSAASGARTRPVRVLQGHLDDLADGIGELAILWRRAKAVLGGTEAGAEAEELAAQLDRRIDDLQFAVLAVRMVPVAEIFDRFPRVVRDAARELDKRVDFRVEGREIELDRALLEEIADPLIHLLRNAVAHGLESPADRAAAGKPERGRLTLRASRERAGVLIEVVDDGTGIDRGRIMERAEEAGLVDAGAIEELTDEAALTLLSRPGFSTADRVSGVAGRGVGLDAVVNRVRALGGAVGMQSEDGAGTTFTLRLPLTFAVADALHVTVSGEDYLIPLTHVDEAVELEDAEVARVRGEEVLRLRDDLVPLVRLREALDASGDDERANAAVVADLAPRRAALVVDGIVGRERIVVKDFDSPSGLSPFFSGATLLADGRPALVLDPTSVLA